MSGVNGIGSGPTPPPGGGGRGPEGPDRMATLNSVASVGDLSELTLKQTAGEGTQPIAPDASPVMHFADHGPIVLKGSFGRDVSGVNAAREMVFFDAIQSRLADVQQPDGLKITLTRDDEAGFFLSIATTRAALSFDDSGAVPFEITLHAARSFAAQAQDVVQQLARSEGLNFAANARFSAGEGEAFELEVRSDSLGALQSDAGSDITQVFLVTMSDDNQSAILHRTNVSGMISLAQTLG